MIQARLVAAMIARLPFYYGWVVLGCLCCACLARSGPAVATFSIFVEPMTSEFGWSRTALSGAVSLGGILAAIVSPMIGTFLDRRGARLVLCLAVLFTGLPLIGLAYLDQLAFVTPLVGFYLLFCVARLNFAGPFDLGIYGALNNWFVSRRAVAASIITLAQMAGLITMPIIGYLAWHHWGDWRYGWIAIGVLVLLIGFVPTWLLMVRRPEDVGLLPDGAKAEAAAASGAGDGRSAEPEPAFTRKEALRTRTFWVLSIFTALVYPVQAGMSLHQAAHMMESGLSPATAATAVSLFSLASAVSGFGVGFVLRRVGPRPTMIFSAVVLCVSTIAMMVVSTSALGFLAAILFGLGIGGVHTILPVAWADFFGRKNYGAIRGVALTVQVGSQAMGPLISGVLRDFTSSYQASLTCFAVLAGAAAIAALLAGPPAAPRPALSAR